MFAAILMMATNYIEEDIRAEVDEEKANAINVPLVCITNYLLNIKAFSYKLLLYSCFRSAKMESK